MWPSGVCTTRCESETKLHAKTRKSLPEYYIHFMEESWKSETTRRESEMSNLRRYAELYTC